MTVRLADKTTNVMLAAIKTALDAGFLAIYSGPQPLSANTGATGTLLGKVTKNGDGTTGLTFDAPTLNVMHKAAAEVWQFTGLANGTAGYCRFYPAAGTPTGTSSAETRIDMAIASSGSDCTLSNIAIVTGAPNSIDVYQLTMPEA
jgi:hypothetical protein